MLNPDTVMREADFPSLTRNRGKRLIVTDGTTLLGADDKAGVAEILTAAEILLSSRSPTPRCASALPRMRKSAGAQTGSM